MTITKKIFVSAFVAALVLVTGSAKAAYMHTTTLKQGSSGTQVWSLQQTLNMTSCKVAVSGAGSPGMESQTFGPKTKVAVQCFQASHGLTADGVVGPMTGAALAAVTGSPSNPSAPCPAGYVCTPNGGNNTPSTGSLSGGAGDANITKTTSDVEDSVKESEDDVKVLGFEVDADGSDVAITSVKVNFKNTGYASSSERLERYLDNVSVWMDDTKLGDADVEDFDRDTGSPDEYSNTIQLSNGIVRDGKKVKFYVAVTAASTIDSDDSDNASWTVTLETVRFTDATGAILTADLPSSLDTTGEAFTFDEAGADDDLSVKSSSANPDDMSVKVDEDSNSDEYLALAYKLDVDDDSSDVTILDLPVDITVNDSGTDATNIDDIIDSVTVKAGSDEWTADLEDSEDGTIDTPGSAQTFHYVLDLDDGDLVIDSGDTLEVKVYITFKDQDDNYGVGTTVVASLDASDIEAEGEDDDIAGSSISADRTGGTLTLNTSVASVSNVDWDVPSTGSLIDFLFTVDAEDDDVDVLLSSITANDTVSGTATVGSPTITRISGDATDLGGGTGYNVAEGDSARFRVRYGVTGANGTYANVTITSVAGQEISDDDQVSPTATRNVPV